MIHDSKGLCKLQNRKTLLKSQSVHKKINPGQTKRELDIKSRVRRSTTQEVESPGKNEVEGEAILKLITEAEDKLESSVSKGSDSDF